MCDLPHRLALDVVQGENRTTLLGKGIQCDTHRDHLVALRGGVVVDG